MDPAKEQAVQALTTQLDEIVAYDSSSLAEGKDLGAINFKAGESLFAQSIEMASEFRSLPLDLLPVATLQQLQAPIQQMAAGLKQVAEFTLVGQQNPEGKRDSILNQAQTYHDQAFTALTPHLAYLSLKSAQVQETMRRSAELLENTQTKVTTALGDIEKKKTEIDGLVRAAKDATAKIGVAQFATQFEDIAKEHTDASRHWLIATAALGILTVVVAIVSIYLLLPTGTLDDPGTVQRIITKLVIISIFYFAALWASRNYRAHRHLSVVNKHRQSALATFETFVKAADDDQTKSAVLLEATHCIFSPAVSGYLGADEEGPANRIIEILKTAGGGSSGSS
jgi:hypothetical protein